LAGWKDGREYSVTANSKHVIFVFLDGVGLGKVDRSLNPFFSARLNFLSGLLDGKLPSLKNRRAQSAHAALSPLNATLGVPGLPQSGTGQTAFLTGVNAPKFIGKHFGPYPYSTLRPLLREKSIYPTLEREGRSVLYANAFPRQFHEYIAQKPARVAATTYAWMSSGHELRTPAELARGEALSADITNDRWDKMGYPDVPKISAFRGGQNLATLAREFDFVFFEFYHTDQVGHKQSMSEAIVMLEKLDEFFRGIVERMDHQSTTLLITSDHGNLEDLSTKSHTRNPVPLILTGSQKGRGSTAKRLTDVPGLITSLLHA
jgi:hypothetical protein